MNYFDVSDSHTIEITKENQALFEITNDVSFVYDPLQTINITVSGGSSTGDVSLTLSGEPFNGILTSPDVGFYDIVAIKDGSLNYFDVSDSHTIEIMKANQAPFEITNDVSFVYDPVQTINITVSGGSYTGDVSFTLSGESFNGNLISPDVGFYDIVAIKDGSLNYFDISDSHIIEITKANQALFEVTNDVSFVYDPLQTINITVSGGSSTGDVSFTLSGDPFGGILTSPDVGFYDIVAIKDGSLNYFDISDSHIIEITKANQALFEITNDVSYTYNPSHTISITVSGGSSTGDVSFTLSGETFDGNLINPIVGFYDIVAIKDGSLNYFDISDAHIIEITKANQAAITGSPSTVNYELKEQTIEFSVSGGSTDSEIIVSSLSNEISLSGDEITYNKPIVVPLHVTKLGDHNYLDINTTISFEVLLNVPHLRHTLIKTPRELVSDAYIALQDIQPYYSIYELKNNTIETVLEISSNGITLEEMKNADFTACQVYNSRLYTLKELIRTGYKISLCHR